MAQQSSRLNRLLTLLDTGSTQATRFAAARQIGDIAKSHPQDLNSLLKKVSQYLSSKKWDTRVAAAHAIGAIAQSIKHTSLKEMIASLQIKMEESGVPGVADNLVSCYGSSEFFTSGGFRSFDITRVLEFGALLASSGQEYDIMYDNVKNPRERLARQKLNLKRRLGMDVCEQFMDVNDMIKDEDLVAQKLYSQGNGNGKRHLTPACARNIQQLVATIVPTAVSRRPSARQLNALKRKAKTNSKDAVKSWPDDRDTEGPSSQNWNSRISNADPLSSVQVDADDEYTDQDYDGKWPFQSFVEQLILDMFDPVWEIRHGSVMALREILTHLGGSAGVFDSDMCSESVFDELGHGYHASSVKKDAQIDLNLQVIEEHSDLRAKRAKFEEQTSVIVNPIVHTTDITNLSTSDAAYMPALSNSGGIDATVKTELDSFSESLTDITRITTHNGELNDVENKTYLMKQDDLIKLSTNKDLMNLVKLARVSWMKNCEFLQECAIRFLCVLSLDRFGDYISDQVVAPVRETCAQALGVTFKYMHPSLIYETLNILLQMQCRPEWEIRHGSLLGIKYLVAVRQEMLPHLLSYILPACKAGLEDCDDDVRAVAADALIPTASAIVSMRDHTLHSIIMLLWDILLDLDDLSLSTSSVMNLLAEIYSQEEMMTRMISKENEKLDLNEELLSDDASDGKYLQDNPYMLSTLAPRLWPFMRHTITSVRYSAIRTLERLLEAGYKRSLSSDNSLWPSFILGDTLRVVFQNLLLESNGEVLECSMRVWKLLVQCPVEDLKVVAGLYISSWLELATTPYGSPLDISKMFWPVALPRKSHFKAAAKIRAVNSEIDHMLPGINTGKQTVPDEKIADRSCTVKMIVGADVDMSVTNTRVITASALGIFASKLHDDSIRFVKHPLWNALTSLSGVQRQVSSMVLISWFKELRNKGFSKPVGDTKDFHESVEKCLTDLLACSDPSFPTKDCFLPYTELQRTYGKMRTEATHLLQSIQSSVMFASSISTVSIVIEKLTPDEAITFTSNLALLLNGNDGNVVIPDDIESAKQQLMATSGYLKCVQNNLHVTVTSLVAAAFVWMSEIPSRLNPIILPLMASVKREQEEVLQQKAAEALAELIHRCIERKPSPNDKLVRNICSLTCMDPSETPQAAIISSIEIIDELDFLLFGSVSNKPKSKVNVLGGEDRSKMEGIISRRGSELALKYLCQKLGPSLFDKLPKIWDCLTEVLIPANHVEEIQMGQTIATVVDPQILINNIQVVRSITPILDEKLMPKLLTLLPCIFICLRHPHIAVRLAASRCITSMAKSVRTSVMAAIIEKVIPMLGDTTSVYARQGAGMLVTLLVQGLGAEMVQYAPLLVVPLLRCMSDCDPTVRQSVTRSFAALVPLLPLARGLPTPSGLNEELTRNADDARFLEQLLDNSNIEDFQLRTELKVTLRRYQQEGINWLAFLRRFKLHGILCDDMGLGKTLQASAIVASDAAEKQTLSSEDVVQPSLIVCPSTLVGHWAFEIEKYVDASLLSTLQYVGSSQDRMLFRRAFQNHNIIITSYDVVRKDIDYLGQVIWNYCILDEGHIIKNTRSKITVAVKQLKAQHRLILSGTPIQNNIVDLWSLFDFLMPGFLGTERQFQATYGKPLLAARDAKCSAKDAEAGALAMEALHKQVMPFLLRRTKDEVLSDLPEKIIQDRFCDLSPVQLKLYEQFASSNVKQEISSIVTTNDSTESQSKNVSPKASTHVFQALQYLLKLCSHPLLVLGEKIHDSIISKLSDLFPENADILSELHQLHHSPKLVALQEILEECGIGLDASSESAGNVGQHRVLIFAQHKALLDIIERDLFESHMKNLTYLRLDGSVEPEKRFDIVKAFNSDPTIDALLLTTHVGGLGLNLTSADTLIFMEHDWNPMRDHQAMDRAHRLGQKKVVNVHRLIMRGTLEEKVMCLQKFKVSIANSVINAENASLKTMNTDQLLDLFGSAKTTAKVTSSKPSNEAGDGDPKATPSGKGLKAILGGLEELWDQSQYTEEYNLNQFLAKLNG